MTFLEARLQEIYHALDFLCLGRCLLWQAVPCIFEVIDLGPKEGVALAPREQVKPEGIPVREVTFRRASIPPLFSLDSADEFLGIAAHGQT